MTKNDFNDVIYLIDNNILDVNTLDLMVDIETLGVGDLAPITSIAINTIY